MACAEIIEVDHTGGKFWIPIDRLSMVSGPNKSYPLMQMSMIPIFGSVFEDIIKVCRNDGPYGNFCIKIFLRNFFYALIFIKVLNCDTY